MSKTLGATKPPSQLSKRSSLVASLVQADKLKAVLSSKKRQQSSNRSNKSQIVSLKPSSRVDQDDREFDEELLNLVDCDQVNAEGTTGERLQLVQYLQKPLFFEANVLKIDEVAHKEESCISDKDS